MERGNNFFKKLFRSKILIILSLLILVFFSVNIFRQVVNRRELKKEIAKLQDEIQSLEDRNQEISDLIGYFESLEFVEKEARTKLNMRKPGEKIIIVDDDQPVGDISEPASSNVFEQSEFSEPKVPNVQKWWNYFFNQETIKP